MYVVIIETGLEFGRMLDACFELAGLNMTSWHDQDADRVVFKKFLAERDEAEAEAMAIRSRIEGWSEPGITWSSKVEFVEDRDWQDSWKEHFHTQRVSDRVVIKPSWESTSVPEGVHVVDIDPGMSFGTGNHETTRACIKLIDNLCSRHRVASFCDVGCGSGILTVLAAKLGCRDLAAFDNDPVALEVARRTFENNGVKRVSLTLDELPCISVSGPFDLVAANMLSHILLDNALAIAGLVGNQPGNRLILSGSLESQYRQITLAYGAIGLEEESRIEDGEWVSGCFRRCV